MSQPPAGPSPEPSPEPEQPYGQQPGGPPPYGTPPPGYGAPPGYGPPAAYGPYGTPVPYGYPQPGYGYAGWRDPASDAVRTQAIVALVVGILLGLACCIPGGIASAVTAGIAMGRADTDVASARRLVRWSWGITATSVVLGVVVLVGFLLLGFADAGFPAQD